VVSPAGPVIPSTSGGLFGHGCVGDQRILARRCTACPSISRRWFPSGADEAMAAAAWWNKSLQLLHRLGDVFSGVGEELVRVRSTGLRCFTVVELSSRAGPSLGVCLALHPGMDWASILLCSRTVVGFVERWWTDPSCSSGEGWIHGHRSWGVFPADVLSWSSSIAALLKAFGRYNFCWPGSCCRFLLSPAMSSTAERVRGGGHGRRAVQKISRILM